MARFEDGWPLFGLSADNPGTGIAHATARPSCRSQHADADTIFVQLHPTLLPIATTKGMSRAARLADEKLRAADDVAP